jgi:hypothetical protein
MVDKRAEREMEFGSWLLGEIKNQGSYCYPEAIRSGALRFNCSTETARRYITKLVSKEGPLYRNTANNILFRPSPDQL